MITLRTQKIYPRQNRMPVISGIVTGIKFAHKAYKFSRRMGRKYQYLDINEKFIRKYVPPGYRKPARYAMQIAIGGGIAYDLLGFFGDELRVAPPVRSPPVQQKRKYMVKSKSKRQCPTDYYYNTRSRSCRRRQRY